MVCGACWSLENLIEKYPIYSLRMALMREDWEGWWSSDKRTWGKVQLVGDDLFVTNTERLEKGISLAAGNSILIKLNQIGSVSETLEAIKMAHKVGYTAISSYRSERQRIQLLQILQWHWIPSQIKTLGSSSEANVANIIKPGWGRESILVMQQYIRDSGYSISRDKITPTHIFKRYAYVPFWRKIRLLWFQIVYYDLQPCEK